MLPITVASLVMLTVTPSLLTSFVSATSPVPPCDTKLCSDTAQPVCATNGNTFGNQCLLMVAACEKPSANILRDREGPCGDVSCEFTCPDKAEPVCGTDRKPYSNICALMTAACKDPSANLTKYHDGPCDGVEPLPACVYDCPNNAVPVCGSDGKTYDDECVLKTTACKDPSANLTKSYDGPCGVGIEFGCNYYCGSSDINPVCGSDGITYNNKCHVGKPACESPENTTVVHDGACGDNGGYTVSLKSTMIKTAEVTSSIYTSKDLYVSGAGRIVDKTATLTLMIIVGAYLV
ncbi:hypothetical protein BC829DRAFT_444958 [Chytridium lagenaria]|nr:hypothetical protein BC829DRAFT_444958 [Chytridium lagenaria]